MNYRELKEWFDEVQRVLETAYLAGEEPWQQSGFSGPKDRWDSLRRPIADCVDSSGSFLDIGCANGYLLECLIGWTAERGIDVTPFGLDISPKLVELTRARLPQFSDHFFVGNALTWTPPKKVRLRTHGTGVCTRRPGKAVRRLPAGKPPESWRKAAGSPVQ